MLRPRSRLGDTVVVLDEPPRDGLERAVMRAPDGGCSPCVVLRIPAVDEGDEHLHLHERFAVDVTARERAPRAQPFVLGTFTRDGALHASVERPPLALSLLDVIARLRASGARVPAQTGAHVLAALAALVADVNDAVHVPLACELSDVTVGLDGALSLRPRTLRPSSAAPRGPRFHLMSPEAALGLPTSLRSSSTAIGYVVYALLALEDPYGAPFDASAPERLDTLARAPRTRLGAHRKDLPPLLSDTVDELLRATPGERPSLDEVRARCAAMQAEDGAAALARVLAPLCADERAQAVDEAALYARTRFETLCAAAPAEAGVALKRAPPEPPTQRIARDALAPSPAALLEDSERRVWPVDERAMQHVRGRLWVDVAPVTGAAYARFLAATGRRAPASWPDGVCPDDLRARPAVDVSLEDARAYARWANKRLPLNDDWLAAMSTLGFERLQGGDVWEWTASRHQSGQQAGHVVRGGRFRDRPDVAPTLLHQSWDDAPAPDIGFRCVAEG